MVWVSDFTYIKVNSGWFYLCIIMDLFSRKIISWNISNKADCNLIINTFNEAYTKRNYPTGLMFHYDRGTQYTATPFRKLLDKFNVVQSFSKKGILLIMLVASVSLSIWKKKSVIEKFITQFMSWDFLYLSTLKDSTILNGHIIL